MTEIEKLAYARSYIDKLANGINPLTNQAVVEHDLVNNVRISRCLFYVSDILRQVAENGGLTKKKAKSHRAPFQLSYQARGCFQFSETPISISEITRRINDLIDAEQMVKLSYKALTEWLIEAGLLSVVSGIDGKSLKRPTPNGTLLGISTQQRQGPKGTYTVVVYNREAQQFLLDNLDAAIELNQRQKGLEIG